MPTLGPVELIVILVIVTMLFGVGKLPEVFGAVGKGIREFRRNSTVENEKLEREKNLHDAEEDTEPQAEAFHADETPPAVQKSENQHSS